MRKIVLYMAISIDGYIACRDGSVDWLDTDVDLGEEHSTTSFLQRIDTILMGRKSYEQALGFGEWAWPDQHTYVFSTSKILPTTPNTTVMQNLSFKFIQDLKQQKGQDLWLFGGGTLNHYFLENDLIDDIMLYVQPTALGDGISLFGGREVSLKHFTLKKAVGLAGGFTLLSYERG